MATRLSQQIANNQNPQQQEPLAVAAAQMGAPAQVEATPPSPAETPEVATARTNSETNDQLQDASFPAKLEQRFPQDIAILYVEARDDRYSVHLHHAEQNSLETEPDPKPDLSFSQMMARKCLPAKIRGLVRAFSNKKRTTQQIRSWLRRLQATLQQQGQSLACLIINDRTDFEIPWELIELDKQPLGAVLPVVRWQDIQDPDDWENIQCLPAAKPKTDRCCGDAIAYANSQELQGTAAEVQLLDRFSGQCFQNVHHFLTHLQQPPSPVGLLFIASHGFFQDDIEDIALGEQQDSNQQLSLIELYGWDFDFFQTSPAIVFMNACHSGRLCRNDRFNVFDPEYRIGFATFFLEQGAKGVIGTLGQVSDRYAAKIAQQFFEELHQNPDLTVAALLRNLRAQISTRLQTEKNEETWYLFLYTFMYVYYGNPMTVLQLNPSGG